jgi:hypothetical protein
MDFSNTHTYPANFEKVVEANYSKEFIEGLDSIEDIMIPVLQEHSSDDKSIKCKTFWQFSGKLDAIANALLMGKPLTWVQTIEIEKEAKTGTIDVVYLEGKIPSNCRAELTFTDNEDGTCTRELKGSIFVKIMMAGPTIEKKLVDGLEKRFASEADALDEYLKTH